MSGALDWGSTAAERSARYPCDDYVPNAEFEAFRAIDIAAPVAVVFRWLCQLRAAPYSYDLLDNFGRRSPRELTPGLDELAVGQQVMTTFHLASFEADRHITIVCDGASRRIFGELAVTYAVTRAGNGSRLVSKLVVIPPGGRLLRVPYRWVMPWGDLLMMRKQFRTLKHFVEQTALGL